MRGLSLTQPWATLVAIGAKRVETRSWSTGYRGRVAIHAAKGFPHDCQAMCWRDPFTTVLIAAGFDRAEQLPRGVIIAVATLRDVVRTEDYERTRTTNQSVDDLVAWWRELNFGDYTPGRFAWVFDDVKPLDTPVACKGALGLWSVPQVVLDVLAGQGVL